MRSMERRGTCIACLALVVYAFTGGSAMSASGESSAACAYVQAGDGLIRIGNAVIERAIEATEGGRLKTVGFTNRLTGREVGVGGDEFRIELADRVLTAGDFAIRSVDADAGKARLTVALEGPGLAVTATYQTRPRDNYVTKTLRMANTGESDVFVNNVWVERLDMAVAESSVRSTEISPTVVFVRQGSGGLFLCLDFPYMMLSAEGGEAAAGYPPFEALPAGAALTSHRSVFGAYESSGVREQTHTKGLGAPSGEMGKGELVLTPGAPEAGAADEAAIDLAESSAWRRCVDRLYPPANRMALLMSGRMCEGGMEELQERWGGNDVLYHNAYLDNVAREIDLYASLGFNAAMFGPAPPAWTPENPDRGRLRKLVRRAEKRGVRLGLYTNSNRGQTLGSYWGSWGYDIAFPWDIPGAEIRDKEGNTIDSPLMCWGSAQFQRAYREAYLPPIELGFGELSHDFTFLNRCYDEGHGHPKGDLYRQVKGLMDFMGDCERIHPGFLDFGFLGWGGFIPHGARYMDMFYVADPWMDLPLPGLNQSVLFADSRRSQMRRFAIDGLPPRLMANMDFFSFHDSVIADYLVYRYVIMQGMAITANWSFGPQFFRDMQHKEYQAACDFIRYWNDWRNERWEILNHIEILSEAPGIGVLEAYMHADEERGYLFVVNPNYFTLGREFTIGASMGLPKGTDFWVHEWFPENKWRLMDWRPVVREGERITVEAPALSVVLLEFAPVGRDASPSVWGVPCAEGLSPEAFGFERRTSVTREIGVRLPAGVAEAEVTVDGQAAPCAVRDGVAMFRETPPENFQGERLNPELRDWVVRCEGLEEGMGRGNHKGMAGESVRFPLDSVLDCAEPEKLLKRPEEVAFEGRNVGKFTGAYIFNAEVRGFRGETRYAEVALDAGKPSRAEALRLEEASVERPGRPAFAECDAYWLSTEFVLPLTNNTLGENAPPYPEHHYLLLPFVDYHNIESLRVWINGEEAAVDSMGYYRSVPGQGFATHPDKHNFSYYVDGTKWGLKMFWEPNTVVIYVKWKRPASEETEG